MKYYKVKFGFNNDDFIVVDETEVERAIIAQTTGRIGIFKEGTITGDRIISITPDVNKIMGWNRTYQPTPEDYGNIPEKLMEEARELLESKRLQITGGTPPDKQLPPSKYSKELSDKFKV